MITHIHKIRNAVAHEDAYDVFLVVKPENIYYISHFPGDDAFLLLTPKKFFYITDKRYSDEAEAFFHKNRWFKVLVADEGTSKLAFCKMILKKYRWKTLGFEGRFISFAFSRMLGETFGSSHIVPVEDFIERFRVSKTSSEVALIKKAILFNEQTYTYLKRMGKIGKTEIEVRNKVEAYMRTRGADDHSFPSIIASGVKSACPHARSDKRRIRGNTILLADMGTRYKCYCSDLTRTFYIGKMSPFFRQTYNIVLKAQEIAMQAIKPGRPIYEAVLAVKDFFATQGVAQYFTHALGHGVGLEVHEQPLLFEKNKGIFREGMVITIEPGLYYPKRGGIRIEDMVLVTKTGIEVLSSFSRSLDSMVLNN